MASWLALSSGFVLASISPLCRWIREAGVDGWVMEMGSGGGKPRSAAVGDGVDVCGAAVGPQLLLFIAIVIEDCNFDKNGQIGMTETKVAISGERVNLPATWWLEPTLMIINPAAPVGAPNDHLPRVLP